MIFIVKLFNVHVVLIVYRHRTSIDFFTFALFYIICLKFFQMFFNLVAMDNNIFLLSFFNFKIFFYIVFYSVQSFSTVRCVYCILCSLQYTYINFCVYPCRLSLPKNIDQSTCTNGKKICTKSSKKFRSIGQSAHPDYVCHQILIVN